MRTLADYISTYATAVNLHLGDYFERLSREDQARLRLATCFYRHYPGSSVPGMCPRRSDTSRLAASAKLRQMS